MTARERLNRAYAWLWYRVGWMVGWIVKHVDYARAAFVEGKQAGERKPGPDTE